MRIFKEHLILEGSNLRQALSQLDGLALDAILFVVDQEGSLKGSLTDGDVRRGLLQGHSIEDLIDKFIQTSPRYLVKSEYTIEDVVKLRESNLKVVPVLNDKNHVVNVINFRFQRSYLPLDAIVMAGGKGTRLKPLTNTTPKPLLRIGDKPIIDHNIDRLRSFGIDDFHISVRYLGEQIEEHYKKSIKAGERINIVWEDEPLGTIGAASKINTFHHDYILLTNSDILTNLDYEDFFFDFISQGADMAVATVPYEVNVPYAVMETSNNHVLSFREKPTYTYYSNGGIYLMKREILDFVPKNEFFNATDLMEKLIAQEKKLVSYPIRQYWLDVGKHEDFEKAQIDIKHIKF